MAIGTEFSLEEENRRGSMNGFDVTETCTMPLGSLEEWTHPLIEKLKTQVDPIDRVMRLVRYLSPQIATAVLDDDNKELFESHRREITAGFLFFSGVLPFSDKGWPGGGGGAALKFYTGKGETRLQVR